MNSPFAPVQWLIFMMLWRMSYETANVNSSRTSVKSYLIEKDSPKVAVNPPEQEWAKKAVANYAAAQGKKWRRWNDAMFERSD
ncbi:MAG: hypothetical protein Q7J73_04030 [Dehalococcoidales bacterium]|nr:hypothetical protein [Dehalococcoidales bacterium]